MGRVQSSAGHAALEYDRQREPIIGSATLNYAGLVEGPKNYGVNVNLIKEKFLVLQLPKSGGKLFGMRL